MLSIYSPLFCCLYTRGPDISHASLRFLYIFFDPGLLCGAARELKRSAAQHGGGAATNATAAAAVSFFHAYKLDYCTNKLLYTVYNLGLWNWVNFCLFIYGGLTWQWSFLNFGRLRTFIVLIGYKDKLMLNQQAHLFKAVFLAYICGKSTILKMNPYLGLPLLLKIIPDILLCLVSSPN